MNSNKKYFIAGVCFAVLLTAYTAYTLLDAFVIPHSVVKMDELVQQTTAPQLSTEDDFQVDNSTTAAETIVTTPVVTEPIITDTSYESENISINIETKRICDTEVYVADVKLKDVSYLKAGLAGGVFGRNVKDTTSNMAEACGAIFAVNGDYYGFRDRGYVMRNGYVYRDTARWDYINDALAILSNGDFELVSETETEMQALIDDGAVQIFSFGPTLVVGGEIKVDENSEVDQAMTSNPRTAIGIVEPLHYKIIVSDGRTDESKGLTLYELAEVFCDEGCSAAYNLDGGGSATMWFMGKLVNKPTTDGYTFKERSVSDIVYIGE